MRSLAKFRFKHPKLKAYKDINSGIRAVAYPVGLEIMFNGLGKSPVMHMVKGDYLVWKECNVFAMTKESFNVLFKEDGFSLEEWREAGEVDLK